jgi:TonB family protein
MWMFSASIYRPSLRVKQHQFPSLRGAQFARIALSLTVPFAVAVLVPAIALAQFAKLEDVAGQLAKQLKIEKPKLVAVADFVSPDGSATLATHYFSWFLSSTLGERGKKYLNVAEHNSFDRDMAGILASPSVPITVQVVRDAAPRIGADFVIVGTAYKQGNSYLLEITAIKVLDGSALPSINTSIQVSQFLQSLMSPFPVKGNKRIYEAGVGGVGMPSCIHCPDPTYTDLARAKGIQGASLFSVVISPDGQAHQLHPLKLIGYGLDEEAYNAIRKWKFKPATLTADGTPVSAIVPIEVTFRLH